MSRFLELQHILGTGKWKSANETISTVLLVLGIDSRFNEGCNKLFQWLCGGKNPLVSEQHDVAKSSEDLEDVVLLVASDSVHVYCNPTNVGLLLPTIAGLPNLHFHCLDTESYQLSEVAEDFKIKAFIEITRPFSTIGIPYSCEPTQGFDPMKLESEWPLIQAHAAEEYGGHGFFTLTHEVIDISGLVEAELYGLIDSLSLRDIVSKSLSGYEKQWSSMCTVLDSSSSTGGIAALTQEQLAKVFKLYMEYRMSQGVNTASVSPSGVWVGCETAYVCSQPSEATVGMSGVDHGPALHMVCALTDSPLAAMRTYFVSQRQPDNCQDLRFLHTLYSCLVATTRSSIANIARSQNMAEAPQKVVVLLKEQCSLKKLPFSLDFFDKGENMSVQLRAFDLRGSVISLKEREWSPCIKQLSVLVHNIPSRDHPNHTLGSIGYAETFIDSLVRVERGWETEHLILTSDIPSTISWPGSRADILYQQKGQAPHGECVVETGLVYLTGASILQPLPVLIHMYHQSLIIENTHFGIVELPLKEVKALQFYDGGSPKSLVLLSVELSAGLAATLPAELAGLSPSATLPAELAGLSPSATLPAELAGLSPSATLPAELAGLSPSATLPAELSPSATLPAELAGLSPSATLPAELAHLLVLIPPQQDTRRTLYKEVVPFLHSLGDLFQAIDDLPESFENIYQESQQCFLQITPTSTAPSKVHTAFPHFTKHFEVAYALRKRVSPLDSITLQHITFPKTAAAATRAQHNKLVITVLTGLPGSHKDHLCSTILSLDGERIKKWVLLRQPFQNTAEFNPKNLQESLTNIVGILKRKRRSTDVKKRGILLVTPWFTEVLDVLQAIASHPDQTVAKAIKIGSVVSCVDPMNTYMWERTVFPKLLENCSLGLVNTVVFTGPEHASSMVKEVQHLIHCCNPCVIFVNAPAGSQFTEESDMDTVLDECAWNRAEVLRERVLKHHGWQHGVIATLPPEPTFEIVCLKFTAAVDKDVLRSKLKALQPIVHPNELQQHNEGLVYHIRAQVTLEGSSSPSDVYYVRQSGYISITEGVRDEYDSSCAVFVGLRLKESALKKWLQSCWAKSMRPLPLKTTQTLTEHELSDIKAKCHGRPLPEGYFYTGQYYVNFEGEKSQDHPLLAQLIEDYLMQQNQAIKAHNERVANEPLFL